MTQATRQESHDDLFTKVHPDYFEVQRRDLWHYERLWWVLLRRLGPPRGRLLDFGSGPGFLLAYAAKLGWNAAGEEPSRVARYHADGLRCYSLQDASPLAPYAACISTETLEHLDSPKAELERIWSLLESGGKLAISVPNDGDGGRGNPLQRLFWGKTKPWLHHTHKHYWSPKTIRQLVESAGFEVVWQGTSFPVELLLILPIPRHLAWKLSRLWPAPPLLWRLGIGRHCLLVAVKRS